ncbi:hypothetical protein [Methylobacterium sp. WSM2598]|uniref:hypothetical protein n=1 Tax=Methylobacterium sp. WSM2598 TaxID=398261 RepID=UPI00037B3AB9|nr:hypothetical protein [Methylobacterium sp. WSM2598]
MSLSIRLDTAPLARFGNGLAAAGAKAPLVLARAANHTGDKAKTATARALVPQTGLPRTTIGKALKVTKASPGALVYRTDAKGGDIRLKYFKARETRPGVSAAPWSRRQVFAHTFMRAGWWPHRVAKPNWNGQVFERAGSKTTTQHATKGKGGMDRFVVVRAGLYLPDEMVRGASVAAWRAVVDRDLEARVAHELGRVLGV